MKQTYFAGLVFLSILFWCGYAAAQATFNLAETGRLPEKRMMHGCAIVGNRIYVMGGHFESQNNANNWTNDVKSGLIDSSGKVATWRAEPNLPYYLSYLGQAVQVVNNRIYIIGGSIYANATAAENSVNYTKKVIWTTVGSDGSLAPWKESAEEFPGQSVTLGATCSSENHLYLVGGTGTGKGILDQVLMSDLTQDGTPVKWRATNKLPVPLWFEGAAIMENRMFVWGGLTKSDAKSVNAKTYSTVLDKDGNVGQWREEASVMPEPMYSCAFCGFNDYLVCVAGRPATAVPSNGIWFARIAEGAVGRWQKLNTNLQARVYVPVGLDRTRGWVYVAGGLDRRQAGVTGPMAFVDAVQTFQLTQPRESRLTVQPARNEAAAPSTGNEAAKPIQIEDALKAASQQNKNVLVFFSSPEVPACNRTWKNVIDTPAFKQVLGDRIFSMVDISGPGMSYSYKYGVFKVPGMAEISPNGQLLKRTTQLVGVEDLAPFRK